MCGILKFCLRSSKRLNFYPETLKRVYNLEKKSKYRIFLQCNAVIKAIYRFRQNFIVLKNGLIISGAWLGLERVPLLLKQKLNIHISLNCTFVISFGYIWLFQARDCLLPTRLMGIGVFRAIAISRLIRETTKHYFSQKIKRSNILLK